MELNKLKTTYCEKKEAQCLIEGKALDITAIVIGDGNGEIPNINKDMTELVNKKVSLPVSIDDKDFPKYKIMADIPSDVEEFAMREMGIVDKAGKLLYVTQLDGTMSNLLSSNISKQIRVQICFTPADGLNVIVIDPTIQTASTNFVEDNFQKLSEKAQPNGYASLGDDGKVPQEQLPIMLPEQEGNADKFLKTDGQSASWQPVPPAITLKQYHHVVFVSGTNVNFGGDYTNFNAIDISSYADNTYRVFATPTSGIIPKTYTEGATEPTSPVVGDVWHYVPTEETEEACYKQYVTITTPATEETEETTTNEWQVVELTELAKIVIASGNVTEVQDSLQYTTEEALTDVEIHTIESYKDIVEEQDNTLSLIPFTFIDLNYTNYTTISANTNYTLKRDGVLNTGSVSTITLVKDGITSTVYGVYVPIRAGNTFKSSVAGKFYYFEGA